MAMLLGAAKALVANKASFPGKVRLLFQPAEEKGPGAIKMLRDGAAEGVDAFFALHVRNDIPCGAIAAEPGPLTAYTGRFTVSVRGASYHADVPEKGVDALLIAAYIIAQIQSIKNKFLNPNDAAIVSVGQMNAGSSHNVIAENAVMTSITRCYAEHIREEIFARIEKIADHTAEIYGGSVSCDFIEGSNAIINDEGLCDIAKEAFRDVLQDGKSISIARSAIGEDFAEYLKYAPGVMVLLGSMADEGTSYPQHNGAFDINEKALVYGAALHARFAVRFLQTAESCLDARAEKVSDGPPEKYDGHRACASQHKARSTQSHIAPCD